MKVTTLDYHGTKYVIVVPQVFVYVDRSTNIKRDIHIWYIDFTYKSLEIFIYELFHNLLLWILWMGSNIPLF